MAVKHLDANDRSLNGPRGSRAGYFNIKRNESH